jgi:hypothetical protein
MNDPLLGGSDREKMRYIALVRRPPARAPLCGASARGSAPPAAPPSPAPPLAAQLWKPDVGDGLDVTDAEETGVGRLVLGAHFGIDLTQRDESMKEWLVKTRSNRGKLTLRRCKTALVDLLLENGCSGEQESTDWMLDNFAATWHTQMFAGLAGGEWCFAVLTAQDYPLRYVRECLAALGTALKSDGVSEQKIQKWLLQPKAEGLNVGLRPVLSSLCQEYADLNNMSKVHAVMDEVNKVKAVMEENIALAVENIDSAEQIEAKTEQLEQGSKIFKANAVQVRQKQCIKSVKVCTASRTLPGCVARVRHCLNRLSTHTQARTAAVRECACVCARPFRSSTS